MRFFNSQKNLYQFSNLAIKFYKIYNYSRLALCLFCALPPLVKISLKAYRLVAVALIMLYLGQNHALWARKILNKVFESKNYTHENTGAGHNFSSANDKCESIP